MQRITFERREKWKRDCIKKQAAAFSNATVFGLSVILFFCAKGSAGVSAGSTPGDTSGASSEAIWKKMSGYFAADEKPR